MSKIKVLHVHTLPVISGSGIHVLLTIKGLDREKYDMEFACKPGGALEEEVKSRGIVFRPIKHFAQTVNPYKDLMTLWELICLMRCERYQIVHSHNSKAGFIGRLAAWISRVPVIVHTIHGFSFHDFEKPPRQALFIMLERIAASWANKLITVSEPLKEWGLKLKIGRLSQYVTIHDGIEIDKYQVKIDIEHKKMELGIPTNNKVVGVVSKLWDGKGHKNILEAAKEIIVKVSNVTFLFVGEGYLRKELEEMTREMGLSNNVVFTGFREDIPEITAVFDVAVLASFFEGLGRVLLEAMAEAKPVVATSVGGIVDVVDDGITGILVEPNNSKELAAAISRLLIDDDLCRRMGEAGKVKISEKFSADTMVKRIDEIYCELLAKKGDE